MSESAAAFWPPMTTGIVSMSWKSLTGDLAPVRQRLVSLDMLPIQENFLPSKLTAVGVTSGMVGMLREKVPMTVRLALASIGREEHVRYLVNVTLAVGERPAGDLMIPVSRHRVYFEEETFAQSP